jgi:hypothetical protein
MNSLRHGLRASKTILPGEHQEDFDRIHDGLQNLYQPQDQAQQYLVDQAAIAQWKLVRVEVLEADCYAAGLPPEGRVPVFDRLTQTQGRLERAYFKAYKELERIKAARQKQPQQPEPDQSADHLAPKFQVAWVNPETGERDVIYRAEYGKRVDKFSDESPSSNPQSGPPSNG